VLYASNVNAPLPFRPRACVETIGQPHWRCIGRCRAQFDGARRGPSSQASRLMAAPAGHDRRRKGEPLSKAMPVPALAEGPHHSSSRRRCQADAEADTPLGSSRSPSFAIYLPGPSDFRSSINPRRRKAASALPTLGAARLSVRLRASRRYPTDRRCWKLIGLARLDMARLGMARLWTRRTTLLQLGHSRDWISYCRATGSVRTTRLFRQHTIQGCR